MGGIVGFWTQPHAVYSPRARATGNGWMIGFGRLVSISAPVATGYMIAANWPPSSLFVVFSVPVFFAALAVAALGVASRRGDVDTGTVTEGSVSSTSVEIR
ncbi:hypothetical protein EON80_21135 [bacterium]|nr:MAG: hypothetical protein EON80_21135 [bacterium]